MEQHINKCYKMIRNNSRLHFISNFKEVEDAGEEEFLMKKVFEEIKEWDDDEGGE